MSCASRPPEALLLGVAPLLPGLLLMLLLLLLLLLLMLALAMVVAWEPALEVRAGPGVECVREPRVVLGGPEMLVVLIVGVGFVGVEAVDFTTLLLLFLLLLLLVLVVPLGVPLVVPLVVPLLVLGGPLVVAGGPRVPLGVAVLVPLVVAVEERLSPPPPLEFSTNILNTSSFPQGCRRRVNPKPYKNPHGIYIPHNTP